MREKNIQPSKEELVDVSLIEKNVNNKLPIFSESIQIN